MSKKSYRKAVGCRQGEIEDEIPLVNLCPQSKHRAMNSCHRLTYSSYTRPSYTSHFDLCGPSQDFSLKLYRRGYEVVTSENYHTRIAGPSSPNTNATTNEDYDYDYSSVFMEKIPHLQSNMRLKEEIPEREILIKIITTFESPEHNFLKNSLITRINHFTSFNGPPSLATPASHS